MTCAHEFVVVLRPKWMLPKHPHNRFFWLYHKQPNRSLWLYHKQPHRFCWLHHKQPTRFSWWYHKQPSRFFRMYHKHPAERQWKSTNSQSRNKKTQKQCENQKVEICNQFACLPCRKRNYALACVGSTVVLSRYQESAMPYLACLRTAVHLLNEGLATLMVKTGRYIKAFLHTFEIQQFRATSRLKAPRNPYNHEVCNCLTQVSQGASERLRKIEVNAVGCCVQQITTKCPEGDAQKSLSKNAGVSKGTESVKDGCINGNTKNSKMQVFLKIATANRKICRCRWVGNKRMKKPKNTHSKSQKTIHRCKKYSNRQKRWHLQYLPKSTKMQASCQKTHAKRKICCCHWVGRKRMKNPQRRFSKVILLEWVGHTRKTRARRIWASWCSIVHGKLGTQNLAPNTRKTKDNVEHKTSKKDAESRNCWRRTTRPNIHMKFVRLRGGGVETLQFHEHEAWKGSNQKKATATTKGTCQED